MVHSSRASVVLVLAVLLLPACGVDEPRAFRLAIDTPAPGRTEVPFPVGVVHGVATCVETLTLEVKADDETYVFQAKPGTTLAFRIGGEPPRSPVKLPGIAGEPPTVEEIVAASKERLAESAPEATVREPAGETAFLVDLPVDREDRWSRVVRAGSPLADLHFLIEVLPRELYLRRWEDGRQAPRLEAPPFPWNDTVEAFDLYKKAEVERWCKAKEEGNSYEPSRPDLLVVPRVGTDAQEPHDFAVFEWSEKPEHQFDGRILENPRAGRDERGKPCVLYDVREPYREAFEAWTGANVGLHMAIVLDWVYLSAPVINSALTDSVQITLGSGPWAEHEAEAEAIARALGGVADGVPASLVAVCTWWPDGRFEVLLSLAERVDTVILLEARGTSEAEHETEERRLCRVPSAKADGAAAVDARLAQMLLGALDVNDVPPLLRSTGDAARNRLESILTSDVSCERRWVVARVLGRLDWSSKELQAFFLAELEHEDADRRLDAVARLHEVVREDGPEASEDLVAALFHLVETESEDERIAPLAVTVLGRFAPIDEKAFQRLLRLAADPEQAMRGRVRGSLTPLASRQPSRLLDAAVDASPAVREAIIAAFANAGASGPRWREIVDLLVDGAHDESEIVRGMAVSGLLMTLYRSPEWIRPRLDVLAPLLADPDNRVRMTVAEILAELGESERLLAAAADESPETRQAAVGGLAHLREAGPEVESALVRAFEDPDLRVRLRAAQGRIMAGGDLEAVLPVLEDATKSDDPLVRQGAAFLLGRVGEKDPRVAPMLVGLLSDMDDDVRVLAALKLEQMRKGDEKTAAILDAVRSDSKHGLYDLVVSATGAD